MGRGRSEQDHPGDGRPLLLVGAVTAVAGLLGLGTIAYWYATDMGWTGTGALLVDLQEQARAAALVPIAAVLVGLVAVLVRGHVPLRSRAGVVVLAANVLLVLGVVLAVGAYPHGRPAELHSHRADEWTTTLPVTEVWGVRAESDTTITLEGRLDQRGCDARSRSVTIELSTGRILEVETLPRSYRTAAEIPPDPTPVDPERFEVRQGSVPFICRS